MIGAPCCNEIYSCHHCHNEATIEVEEDGREEPGGKEVGPVDCDDDEEVGHNRKQFELWT
ncbi:putative Zinc finger, CHY-type [Helianthus anomalus]